MTPEQLLDLRERLPPFGEQESPSAEFESYYRYYGLDFHARRPRLSHDMGYILSGDYTLAVHYWYQKGARANLLLLHGYFDHTGLFSKLIDWGLAQQCNVLIFDLPGHGLSSGEPAVIDDFADYSRAIKDVLAAVSMPAMPLWVMAQSTGCAALIDYARKYDWPFVATVLLAPLVRPANWILVQAGHVLLGRVTRGIKRTFSANSSDNDFLAFLKRDPLQSHQISLRWVGALRRWLRKLPRFDLGVGPALIIQGDVDATVDWRYNVGFVETLFPGSHVEYLQGAGHQLANESAQYRREYLAHVTGWLGQRGISLASRSGIESG